MKIVENYRGLAQAKKTPGEDRTGGMSRPTDEADMAQYSVTSLDRTRQKRSTAFPTSNCIFSSEFTVQ